MAHAGGAAVALAIIWTLGVVIGVIFFGELALIVAVILLGLAVIGVTAMTFPASGAPEPPHPTRYACPGCGGDVYMGQAVCHACGRSLIAAQPPGQ